MKKVLSIVLCALMLISTLSVNVFADDVSSLIVGSPSPSIVAAGSRFSVSLVWPDRAAKYQVSVESDNFYYDYYTNVYETDKTSCTLSVTAKSGLPEGRYPVAFTVKGIDSSYSESATIYVNVTNPVDETFTKPEANVSIVSPIISSRRVFAGETFGISFVLNGNASYDFNGYYVQNYWDSSVSTTVSISGNGFSLAGSYAEQDAVQGLNNVTVLADDSLSAGRHQVTLQVTATDKSGNSTVDSKVFNIDVEASSIELDEKAEAPKFALTAAGIPESKGKSNLSTKINLTFKNTTSFPANDASVTITGLGGLILNTYTDVVELGDIEGGNTIKASFPVKFPESPTAQTTVTFTLKYKDISGAEHSENYNVYLQATEKKKDEVLSDTAFLTPKVIVSNYSVDVEKIISGEEFVLKFILKNTSHDKDLKNMIVEVRTSSYSGTTTESVFSPIDGTTSFYTEHLPKDGEVEYEIRLKTSASAGAKSYPISLSYSFEYEDGNRYTSGNGDATINLPVVQPIKFELMEWYPPAECPADGTYLSFQYFNKSKNPMTNLAVSVEGDFTMPTQYLSTLGASSADFFNGMMYPVDASAVGETKKAVLVFTFEDASSNEQRIEYPFEVMITEAMNNSGNDDMMWSDDPVYDPGESIPADSNDESDGTSASWKAYALYGGIGVVVVIVIVVIAVIARKRKLALYDDDDE